ncbi:hypothetical protein JY96_14730 [Aquabacterium sp. NJ1]|uniref:PEP-CTERM sorting domain-containing protein n=1 Tax=Aquabacterium sp. NJ1 TaxID=1538295 RepID=UPI00052B9132|nr:hypothetical protein JY96_14730 [Aquabacterium sp. NJ1]
MSNISIDLTQKRVYASVSGPIRLSDVTTLNLSAAVPEPSTWAMDLPALALLGLVLRRSGRY